MTFANQITYHIPDDVMNFLAEFNISSNLRHLFSLLKSLLLFGRFTCCTLLGHDFWYQPGTLWSHNQSSLQYPSLLKSPLVSLHYLSSLASLKIICHYQEHFFLLDLNISFCRSVVSSQPESQGLTFIISPLMWLYSLNVLPFSLSSFFQAGKNPVFYFRGPEIVCGTRREQILHNGLYSPAIIS